MAELQEATAARANSPATSRRRAPGSRSCATASARRSRSSRTTCRRAPRWPIAPGALQAHAVGAHRSFGRARRRRHDEPDARAACSRRSACTPRPCTASSRPSSASRSPAPRSTAVLGLRHLAHRPSAEPQRAGRAHEHAHGRHLEVVVRRRCRPDARARPPPHGRRRRRAGLPRRHVRRLRAACGGRLPALSEMVR